MASAIRPIRPLAVIAMLALACTPGSNATPAVAVVDHVTITGAAAAVPLASAVNLTAYAYGPNNVQLVDRNFSWASSDPATASVAGSGGYALVTLHATGGPVTISATLDGTAGSTSFTVTGASPPPSPPPLFAQLALTTQPSATGNVGIPFAVQPVVQLQDANGAAVALSGAVITATLATGIGALGGTTIATTNAAGAATFTDLSLSAAGSSTIRFSVTSSSGTLSVTSQPIVVSVPTIPTMPLTVRGAGAGNGTVTSNPNGISCTSAAGVTTGSCSGSYSTGTLVTLTATPTGGVFAGWSGACVNISGACQVTLSQGQSVTATFALPTSCPNTTFTLGIPVTDTLTSACPVFTSYYATYQTVLPTAQTIAVSISASFDPVALGVQVSSTGSAVGFFGTSPLQFRILAPAGTLTLFPNGYTPGTTGIFTFTATQTSAFVANCESAVLVPGGTWNESLTSTACTNGQFYYDAYVIEIPAGATATATMTSTFGPALALYDPATSTLLRSATAVGSVSTLQYTNSSGQPAIYELRATSGSAGLTGAYSLSFSLSGPGSLRQAGSSSGGYTPVGAAIRVKGAGQ